jgi:hypothetical protein
MAKKDGKKKQDEPRDALESIRAAFERTFQAYTEGAQSTGERTRAVIDELASAAARFRQTMEEPRLADDIKGLRREIEALSQRVAALEAAKPAPAARRTGTRKPATRATPKPATRTRPSSSPSS